MTDHVSAERLAAAALGSLEDAVPSTPGATPSAATPEHPTPEHTTPERTASEHTSSEPVQAVPATAPTSGPPAGERPAAGLDALTPPERSHVADCSVCRYELDAVLQVTALSTGGAEALHGLREPDPAIWDRIAAAVARPEGLAPAAEVADRSGPHRPDSRGSGPRQQATAIGPRQFRRRSRAAIALVAAAVGLVVGIGGTVAVRRVIAPAPVVLASTSLRPLPGEQGSGTAELVRSGGVLDLRVSVRAGAIPDRFYQLWLLDSAGDRMYDLGTLPPTGTASYPVPAELARGLGTYTTVDVSIEPYDGNPAHSHHSLVRGQLPA